MKKHIFSVLLLSMLLAVGLVSSAGATTYYSINSSTMSNSGGNLTQTIAEGDAITSITFSIPVATTTTDGQSGYGTAKSVAWSLTAATNSSVPSGISLSPTSSTASDTNNTAVTTTLSGKPAAGIYIFSVTATLNSVSKSSTSTITLNVVPKPTFSTTSLATMKAGTALSDVTVSLENPTMNSSTGASTIWVITAADKATLDKYGLAITNLTTGNIDSTTNTYRYTSTYNASTAPSLTITGTPTQAATSVSFSLTAISNYNNTNYGETTQKFTFEITGTAPQFATWMPGDGNDMGVATLTKTAATNSNLPLFFRNGVLVKGRSVATVHPSNKTTANANYSFDIVVYGTLPITLKVEGLPDGLSAKQVSGDKNTLAIGASQAVNGLDYTKGADASGNVATYNGENGYVWTRISGSPSKVGVYKKVKVTATNVAGSVSRTFTIDVTAIPSVNTSEVKATWGKELKSTLKANDVNKLHPMTWHVSVDKTSFFTQLPEGLSLDKETGTITGTFESKDRGRIFPGTDKTATFTVPIFVSNDAGSSDKKAVKIVMTLAKPVIVNKKITIPEMTAGKAITPFSLDVSGGGILSWTVSDDAPMGITVTQSPDYTLWFRGTPIYTAKGQSAKYTIANTAGNDTATLKFTITSDEVKFNAVLPGVVPSIAHSHVSAIKSKNNYTSDDTGVITNNNPTAGARSDYALNDELEDFLIAAYPGPITWSAKNLPAGITLSVDMSDSRKAYLKGKFTKPTKLDKSGKSIYYITATNKNISDKSKGVKTISADLRVFDKPEITTKKLSALTTGKKYTAKIGVKNAGADSLRVTIHAADGLTALSRDTTEKIPFRVAGGSYGLFWSSDIMSITGSLDRIPDGGKFYVSISADTAGGSDTEFNIPVEVKGQAPKLTTTKIEDFTSGKSGDVKITTSGTRPIALNAFIDNKTAKAYGLVGENETVSVDLSGRKNGNSYKASDKNNTTGFVFIPESADNGTGTFEYLGSGDLVYSGDRASYKGLPITFVASNAASTKLVTKAIKVTVEGTDPELWFTPLSTDSTTVMARVLMSQDVTVYAKDGTLPPMTFYGSGDKPVVISAKGDKNGVTTTLSADNVRALTVQGSGINTEKESKTTITVTATNPSTKKKVARKITVIQQLKPTITTKEKGLTKEIELGKKFSLKLAAKGSKTIVWSVNQQAAASLDLIGLSLDRTKGAITGTPTAPTSDDTHKLYQPFEMQVVATNGAGSDDVPVTIGVKGKKPKVLTKTLTISRDVGTLTVANSPYKVVTNIGSDDATAYLVFSGLSVNSLSFGDTSSATPGSSPYNEGVLIGTPSKATKGTGAKITVTNLGTEVKASVKIIIRDPAPVVETPEAISIAAKEKEKATGSTTLSLSAGAPSDGTFIKWKLTKKPSTKGISVKLKDNKNNTATVTVTVPKGFEGGEDTYEVTATNGVSKLSATVEGSIAVEAAPTPAEEDESALPDDESALPDEETAEETESETEAEETAETETEETAATEGEITLGTARTEAQLTAGQRTMLEKGGYVIAAILPEITVTADDQYDIDVELNENAPEGAELVWFAFPSTTTEDADIVDFYDEAGAEIKGVPASHKIVASPWFNEGVTYAPVIAVKAENAGGARDTLEGAEEGSVVTEEALETAAAPAE